MTDNKKFIEECEKKLAPKFAAAEETAYYNQIKVIRWVRFMRCRSALRRELFRLIFCRALMRLLWHFSGFCGRTTGFYA